MPAASPFFSLSLLSLLSFDSSRLDSPSFCLTLRIFDDDCHLQGEEDLDFVRAPPSSFPSSSFYSSSFRFIFTIWLFLIFSLTRSFDEKCRIKFFSTLCCLFRFLKRSHIGVILLFLFLFLTGLRYHPR